MGLSIKNDQLKISAYQVAIILLISRCQSFMHVIGMRSFFNVETSDIFISIIIAMLAIIIIYIPAMMVLKKFKYINIIDICKKVWGKYSNIISIILFLYFFLVSIKHLTGSIFFVTAHIYIDASPLLIVAFIGVVIYALFLGIEGVFRSGAVIFAIFFLLNVIVFFLLFPTYDMMNMGPFVLSDVKNFTQNTFILTFSEELIALLILAEYSKEKTKSSFLSFVLVVFIMQEFLILAIILAMGGYANSVQFPISTITAMVRLPILDRLESAYIVLDTMLSFIKTCLYIFLAKKSFQSIIGKKFDRTLIVLISTICLILSICIVSKLEWLNLLSSLISSPIIVSILVVLLPVSILITSNTVSLTKQPTRCTKVKENK